MSMDPVLRGLFLTVFLLTLVISGYHRRRARAGETIARKAEGTPALLLRAAGGLLLLASILLAAVAPPWMAWSVLPLPAGLRWAAAAVALACLPLLWWVFTSIGSNISETVLTKKTHQLVTHGPYRWVRHPLYAGALLEILSLALVAESWLLFLLGCAAAVVFRFVVIPKEERNLIQAFGRAYEGYRQRTGALFPRFLR